MRLQEQVFSAQVVCVLAGVLVAFHRASGQSASPSSDRCSLTFGYTSGGQPVASQSSPSPFKITVSPKQYSPGSVVTVTIESSVNFREIVLQARIMNSDAPVGTWQTPPSGYQLLTCTNAGDMLTNTNNDLKSPNVQFQWTAPSSAMGYVKIVGTVAIYNDAFWTGHKTAIEDSSSTITGVCATSPCANGICWSQPNSRHCSCDSAYEGVDCDRMKYNPYCPDNTACGFGGDCFQSKNNPDSFVCGCRSPFQGSDCTSSPNCSSDPCQNSGACTFSGSVYTCTCVNGYDGDMCQTSVNCSSQYPCLNQGTCDSNGQCACTSGFSGNRCETETSMSDFCTSNPCKNGAACSSLATKFNCACKNGYTGVTCSYLANNMTELLLEIWWIALVCLIGVLFIVLVVAVLVTICQSRPSEDRQVMVGNRKGLA